MAGDVKADQFNPPYRGRIELMPRVCPSTDRFGEVCCRLDTHTGGIKCCAFLYGIHAVIDEKHQVEGRSLGEMRDILASWEVASTRQYTCLCLQAPPAHTQAGVYP